MMRTIEMCSAYIHQPMCDLCVDCADRNDPAARRSIGTRCWFSLTRKFSCLVFYIYNNLQRSDRSSVSCWSHKVVRMVITVINVKTSLNLNILRSRHQPQMEFVLCVSNQSKVPFSLERVKIDCVGGRYCLCLIFFTKRITHAERVSRLFPPIRLYVEWSRSKIQRSANSVKRNGIKKPMWKVFIRVFVTVIFALEYSQSFLKCFILTEK